MEQEDKQNSLEEKKPHKKAPQEQKPDEQAIEEQKIDIPSDDELFAGAVQTDIPSDNELFADAVQEEPSERELFAGNDDFYKYLASYSSPAESESQHAGSAAGQFRPIPALRRKFSTIQKVLAFCIILIVGILIYALLVPPSVPVVYTIPAPTAMQLSQPQPSAESLPQIVTQQKVTQQPQQSLSPQQPTSLKVAETFYLQKEYDKASDVYDRLRQSLPATPQQRKMRDFLQLRMALCMNKKADFDQADHLFRTVSESYSPVVRIIANYYRCLFEMQKKQYLKARIRAYQTFALINAVDFDKGWALSLQPDCHFLIAESITRNALSLSDADKDVPEDLWSLPDIPTDPFINLSEEQLRDLLDSGSKQLSKGLLSPQIQKLKNKAASPYWSVTCHGSSIEELLSRFAANTGLDIHWPLDENSSVNNTIRERPVSLYLPAITSQQFVAAAAGCVGLLATQPVEDETTVNIFNPDKYASLTEQISLLSKEAVSLWQSFLLMFHNDQRIPNAHFALGILHAQNGQIEEAIAEFKLVANRRFLFKTSLAPFALLHSSKLKAELLDYSGARRDLKQLVEQYPDTDISSKARLYLADVTMKAGLEAEAAQLYKKAYELGPSSQLQFASALGAAKCFYKQKDYQDAEKWFLKYIDLAKDHTDNELYSSYLLLGKTCFALEKPQKACQAFQYALAGPLSKEEYIETFSALIEAYMMEENFIKALDTLENIHSMAFSQKESVDLLLLKCRVLQAMGLTDKVIAVLRNRADYIYDSQLKARIIFELTKCYITKGDLELARRHLTKTLITVEPGPLAQQIALELADVCLKLGHNSQTISICSQLLESGPREQIKQKTLNIMATAHKRLKNYDKAASVLLGQWEKSKTQNEKTAIDSPDITDRPLANAK